MPFIKEIPSTETYTVRHPVLRAGKPVESCRFEGDDLPTTTHFGLFLDNELAGILSVFQSRYALFEDEKQFQFRGMAVLEKYQGKGLGDALVRHAEAWIQEQNGTLIWFNAREIAVKFYRKMGYEITGAPFEIGDIGVHYVMFKTLSGASKNNHQ